MILRDGNGKHLVHWLQIAVFGSTILVFCLTYFPFVDPRPVDDPIVIELDDSDSCNNFDPLLLPSAGTLQVVFASPERFYIQIGADTLPDFELFVDPIGYVSLVDHGEAIRPLATFPHIELLRNEVWIDWVDSTAVLIRINRELYWQGEIPFDLAELQIYCP